MFPCSPMTLVTMVTFSERMGIEVLGPARGPVRQKQLDSYSTLLPVYPARVRGPASGSSGPGATLRTSVAGGAEVVAAMGANAPARSSAPAEGAGDGTDGPSGRH